MRRTLSDKGVAALKPRATRYAVPDPELRGHWIRVQPGGSKSFAIVTRNPSGKQIWKTIGHADMEGGIAASREMARTMLARARKGLPAVEPKPDSFGAVTDNWMKRHVGRKEQEENGKVVLEYKLRTGKNIDRLLASHVLPDWKDREFTSIRRSDVTALLDTIEDDSGGRTADLVLGIIRTIMNWFATRHDDYVPPVVRGMRRTNPKERARKRKLDDAELRAVWKVAEGDGAYGALVRLLLLTGQRRAKVAAMRWQDIADDGTWVIPAEAREKGNAMELKLPQIALDIIKAQTRFDGNPYVFAARQGGHINGFSERGRSFDQKLAQLLAGMPQWQLHDLRRTARSLMSRAGVSSEHAERVLGHAIAGVEGTYDRHEYRAEKADALERLATLIDGIVQQRSADVVPIKRKAP